MKIRINRWLSCGLALMIALGLSESISQARSTQVAHQGYRDSTVQPVSRWHRSSVSIDHVTVIPNQGYTNYVTGRRALYTHPVTGNARIIYSRRAMQYFAKRRTRFMTYQRAVTNQGSVYYKIVSLRHSVRGWMYQDAIRSMLNRQQQSADFTFSSQILHSEMIADQSKHESLADQSRINLSDARKVMNEARNSVRQLKGTPDYQGAQASLNGGQRYLHQIARVWPSSRTLNSLVAIRSEYNRAAKEVSAAQTASLHRNNRAADYNIRRANRSLRHVSRILSQIRNWRDRQIAMSLFDHAWSYVNRNYSFDPISDLNGRDLDTRRSSNSRLVNLIKEYETNAQNSIMDLYPHLNNFDVALMDAYRAQNDLNRANDIVSRLKGAHVRKAELGDIELDQHNINNLWNI